jgi:uncharacterized protein YndB with AHSA1/START domain
MADRRVSVRLTRRYDAPPAEVWAALTEPESIGRWLARPRRVELAAGGAFELQFTDDEATRLDARVTALEPERLLELDWHYPGERPSLVRIELAPDDDGTLLVLDHLRLEERLGQGYATGWTHHLERLESIVEREEVPR